MLNHLRMYQNGKNKMKQIIFVFPKRIGFKIIEIKFIKSQKYSDELLAKQIFIWLYNSIPTTAFHLLQEYFRKEHNNYYEMEESIKDYIK